MPDELVEKVAVTIWHKTEGRHIADEFAQHVFNGDYGGLPQSDEWYRNEESGEDVVRLGRDTYLAAARAALAAMPRIEALVEALEIAERYMPDRQAEYPERLERDREIVRAALQGESEQQSPDARGEARRSMRP